MSAEVEQEDSDKHIYLGRFGDFDAFFFGEYPCITNPEMRPEDASRISTYLKSRGIPADTGKYKHYANVFGVSEKLDEQTCIYFNRVELKGSDDARGVVRRVVQALNGYRQASA